MFDIRNVKMCGLMAKIQIYTKYNNLNIIHSLGFNLLLYKHLRKKKNTIINFKVPSK